MNTIEETIKMAGFGKRKMMRKQIELFEKDLEEGEKLMGVAMSHPKSIEQLYITNKRVISHKMVGLFENTRVDVPLDKISSVNTNIKGFNMEIQLVSSINGAAVSRVPVHIGSQVKQLIQTLLLEK